MPRIENVLKSYPHELSGGMRQRVMIALALAGRPELMVADEPTTALDVTVQANILKLLGELRRETGMSLLMIAHDLAVVGVVSERVAVMRDGEILETGTTHDVLTQPQHPYTKALLAARPETSAPGAPLAVLNRLTGELRAPEPAISVETDARTIVALTDVSVTYRHATGPRRRRDVNADQGRRLHRNSRRERKRQDHARSDDRRCVVSDHRIRPRQRAGVGWPACDRHDPRRDVQMIFQDPFGSLTPWRTPREIVAEVLRRWQPMNRRAAAKRGRRTSRRSGSAVAGDGPKAGRTQRWPVPAGRYRPCARERAETACRGRTHFGSGHLGASPNPQPADAIARIPRACARPDLARSECGPAYDLRRSRHASR